MKVGGNHVATLLQLPRVRPAIEPCVDLTKKVFNLTAKDYKQGGVAREQQHHDPLQYESDHPPCEHCDYGVNSEHVLDGDDVEAQTRPDNTGAAACLF